MMAKLHHLIPPSTCNDVDHGAAELLRAVMVRSNFNPTTRHELGWRGVQEIVSPDLSRLALTAKITGMHGVYGVNLEEKGDQGALFAICYFPDPEESLVESFSLQAGLAAFQDDFLDRVRRFSLDPELKELFTIGQVHIRIDPASLARTLCLTAPQTMRTIARDGITTGEGPDAQWIVRPGQADQNLPGFETAMPFFRVLASSFAFTQKARPDFLNEHSMAGFEIIYGRDTNVVEKFSRDCQEIHLTLGFDTEGTSLLQTDTQIPCRVTWHHPDPLPEEYAHEPWWEAGTRKVSATLRNRDSQTGSKPRLIILTGFLGSGKTSFLDRFIEDQTNANCFVAVVQNEIGEKGLDGKILGNNYAVTEMDEGCVCCTLAGNLRAAVQGILDRFDPDFIVLETTGLANPANLLQEVDDLEDILEFGSITTVVDAAGAASQLNDFEVARGQIRLADTILLNKCDLIDDEDLSRLESRITSLNPTACVHRTTHGNIRATRLYGINLHEMAPKPDNRHLLPDLTVTHLADHIGTRLLTCSAPFSTQLLLETFKIIQPSLLRAKGVIDLEDEPGPVVFQYSPGVYSIEPAPENIGPDRFLVFIGQGIHDLDLSSLAT
jgi:G3E family GTPase